MNIISKIKRKYHHYKNIFNHKKELNLWHLKVFLQKVFNPTIRYQTNNPKSIPIIIISFNQLFYLKQLVDFLLKRNFSNIIIVDNNSTFSPLIAYFDSLQENTNITIHKLKENHGHLVFWGKPDLFEKYSKGYYVVSDADIVPINSTPENFMEKFLSLLDANKDVTKVGFSLFLEDIPDTNPNKENIINWENQFWENKIDGNYFSSIDTTFALYRPNYIRNEHDFLRGIRTEKPYTARHGGWYINPKALTEEQLFYIKTANNSSSWLTNENGELINDTFKDHYTNKND
ncbi:MAG: glycosyltransferase family 2 protein [Flavobacteriales bacterium]|nr:glycosyltransferase family 2 protein [Flavobacteriales bacterium]MCB9363338.1 glycosyltransferase family 2 protein [Flavobacteriales bacterium]